MEQAICQSCAMPLTSEDMYSKFGEQAGMTNEQMKEYCTKVFPTLKRWKEA